MTAPAYPQFEPDDVLGTVESVDTTTVILKVEDPERLQRLKVNRLVALQVDSPQQHLIGVVERIRRTAGASQDENDSDGAMAAPVTENVVRVALVGTFKQREGELRNVFKRSLDRVPDIGNFAYPLEGDDLTAFMGSISRQTDGQTRLRLGHYSIDPDAVAYIDGDKFFQRHAAIVGSTGSGKSNTTAYILEQIAATPAGNALVLDVHGEYAPLAGDPGVALYRIAAPSDTAVGLNDGVVHLPFWLLRFDALLAILVERSDASAINQAAVLRDAVLEAKTAYLRASGLNDLAERITVDSPVPFRIADVLTVLRDKDAEREAGSRAGQDRAGQHFGKLTRMIARMESKIADRRLSYMFAPPEESYEYAWLDRLATHLASNMAIGTDRRRVRVLDLSEVPSEVLPLTAGLVADVIFQLHQWTEDAAQPIALFCDEAHLYIPVAEGQDLADAISLATFERIAKEGRKYGIGLVIVSQRPAELNRTVLSQCNNYIALRLLNMDDQNTIRRLLPDNIGGYADLLPTLDTGEAIVVGDACLLPSRIRMARPTHEPRGTTSEFWQIWAVDAVPIDVTPAVLGWRSQSTGGPPAAP